MRLLRAFFVALLTAVVGCVLAFFVGDYLTRLAHVPEMEGQRGMTVIFLCVPLGILAGRHEPARVHELGSSPALDEIPGVGERRKKALIRQFGSVRSIRAAGVEDIAAVEGVGPKVAERIHQYLKDHPA